MVLKLIACEVFYREACLCVATAPHRVDIEFTAKNAHEQSDKLRSLVQSKIDAAEASDVAYDAILLGFGLCGNGVLGVGAKKTRVVLPRAFRQVARYRLSQYIVGRNGRELAGAVFPDQ